jgi:hypothetical protein
MRSTTATCGRDRQFLDRRLAQPPPSEALQNDAATPPSRQELRHGGRPEAVRGTLEERAEEGDTVQPPAGRPGQRTSPGDCRLLGRTLAPERLSNARSG